MRYDSSDLGRIVLEKNSYKGLLLLGESLLRIPEIKEPVGCSLLGLAS